jgi:NADH:ubiquinone oxidoreductase subunit 4 (subunit M)
LIFWIGVYPKPLLSYINPQTEAVVVQVQPDYFRNAPAAQRVAEQKEEEQK